MKRALCQTVWAGLPRLRRAFRSLGVCPESSMSCHVSPFPVDRAHPAAEPAGSDSLVRPAAIADQNVCRCPRCPTGGRPGERRAFRVDRSERRFPAIATSFNRVLRRSVETKLHAAIAVMDKASRDDRPVGERLVQGLERQLGAEMILQRPTEHLAAEGIEDDREIGERFGQADIGDVGDPSSVSRRMIRLRSSARQQDARGSWSIAVGTSVRASFGQIRQPCRLSVVAGTKDLRRRHERLSSRIKRSTRLWFTAQPSCRNSGPNLR